MSDLDHYADEREAATEADAGMAAEPEAFRDSSGDDADLPESEAYDNAETFGRTLLQYADTVQYVNALYPDQMDVNEAKEAVAERQADTPASENE
ncbi:hypothetical protein [Paenibacillus flagellatus]|uniref:Uncharacterized protein n=1 Tax=Paenibacillus flagellatus TaxID=2211139 RepID=A0A2V5KCR1_9BACL|nr:hypothetical protein [Paenibacillus flagellatus]PYI57419.1 hypothetical protein DLM86_02985 [Paenibacillus flagellatus]